MQRQQKSEDYAASLQMERNKSYVNISLTQRKVKRWRPSPRDS
jgi:hypothetical protein